MTYSELKAQLRAAGFVLDDNGGKHDIYRNPKTKAKAIVPRHNGEVPTGTLNQILKAAGLK